MMLVALALLFTFALSTQQAGKETYDLVHNKESAVADGRYEAMEAVQGNAESQSRGFLHPDRKRSPDEVMIEDMSAEELQSGADICLLGIGNCSRCNFELKYTSCSICYSCCSSYSYALKTYFYYDCTVCSTRYCYYCRNSYHNPNGTCYDLSRYQVIGQNGLGNCREENQYPFSCFDTVYQVYIAQTNQKPLIIADIQAAWNGSTLQEINTTVRPIITGLTDFVPIEYNSNNNVTKMYCVLYYTSSTTPTLNQTDAMFSYINTSFAFQFNIQARRITYYQNTTDTPGYFNITVSSGSSTMISMLFLGLSMVFLLF